MTAFAGFVLLGALAGLYGSVIGLGGGAIVVPALLILWHMPPHAAVAVSLTAVFANSLSGAFAYGRQGRVDLRSGVRFAMAVIPGSIAGAFVVQYIPQRLFTGAFGALFTLIAFALAFTPLRAERRTVPSGPGEPRKLTDSSGKRFTYRVRMRRGLGVSFCAGLLSSLLGIGGGVLHVPAMILLLGFPHHVAVATSTFIIAVSTLFGAAAFALQGAVDWNVAVPIALGAVVAAQAGARIARRMSTTWVGRLLALALAVIGIRMLLMSYWGR